MKSFNLNCFLRSIKSIRPSLSSVKLELKKPSIFGQLARMPMVLQKEKFSFVSFRSFALDKQ